MDQSESLNRLSDLIAQIHSQRKRKRFTQQEMADKVGVHVTTYGRWELGKRDPRFSDLMKIGKILEFDVLEFLSDKLGKPEKQKKVKTEVFDELIETIQDLIESQVEAIERDTKAVQRDREIMDIVDKMWEGMKKLNDRVGVMEKKLGVISN